MITPWKPSATNGCQGGIDMFDWLTQLLVFVIGVCVGLVSYKYTDSYLTYKKMRKVTDEVFTKYKKIIVDGK